MGIDKIIAGITPRKKSGGIPENVLVKNNIRMLTLDERWNSLFAEVPRTPGILRLEDALNSKLKDMARLTTERKTNASDKKALLARIMTLTEEAFTNENAAARREIELCEIKVREINRREPQITDELNVLESVIRRANVELLEQAVDLLYPEIHKAQKRVAALNDDIEALRGQLKERISEKEGLVATYDGAYQFLHGLLGAEQIEELDKRFSI